MRIFQLETKQIEKEISIMLVLSLLALTPILYLSLLVSPFVQRMVITIVTTLEVSMHLMTFTVLSVVPAVFACVFRKMLLKHKSIYVEKDYLEIKDYSDNSTRVSIDEIEKLQVFRSPPHAKLCLVLSIKGRRKIRMLTRGEVLMEMIKHIPPAVVHQVGLPNRYFLLFLIVGGVTIIDAILWVVHLALLVS